MLIYIDSEFKCHSLPGEGLREIDTPFFDGKCDVFIEGYRYVPKGEVWKRADGVEIKGEMIAPWKPYPKLYIAQLEYELKDADNALERLGVVNDTN